MIMLKKIEATMVRYNMLPMKSVLVGLSGGADSVVLTYILHKLSKKHNFTVYTAHLNHNLRGKEADRDEAFCREFSESLGIKHFSKKVNIREISERTGDSEEVCGRNIRYDFFREIIDKESIEKVATAHHKNDNAETIIMNFLRGSGIAGLSGIPYVRDYVIRPMLDISRSEIEEFCSSEGLSFVTDSTNGENIYTRNKIRNVLMPELIGEYNKNLVDVITLNGEMMAVENDYLDKVADNEFLKLNENEISTEKLLSLHTAISMRIIRKMTERITGLSDISYRKINDILNLAKSGATGKTVQIKDGAVARIEYDKLIIEDAIDDCEDFSYTLRVGESRYIKELGYTISIAEATEKTDKNKWVSYITIPDGEDKIIIRNRRNGDVFYPKGMAGRKKVKEYMIDKKIPRYLRSRTGILCIGDEIAWIIGYREDGRFEFHEKGIKITVSY